MKKLTIGGPKLLGILVSLLILVYVNSDILGLTTQISEKEFYEDLFENSEKYQLVIALSVNFKGWRDVQSQNAKSSLINCLKSEPRTPSNLGLNDSDKFVYLSLVSDDYKYDLAFKWLVESKKAFISGVERRTNLSNGETHSLWKLRVKGGSCFDEVLNRITF